MGWCVEVEVVGVSGLRRENMFDKGMGVDVGGRTECCRGCWDELWRVEVGVERGLGMEEAGRGDWLGNGSVDMREE